METFLSNSLIEPVPIDWNVSEALVWIVHRGAPAPANTEADQYADALIELNNAVALCNITAWGRPSDTYRQSASHRPREPIPANIIDELRQIDPTGCCAIVAGGTHWHWLHDPGPFFYDVRFRVAEVKKQWSAQSGALVALPRPSRSALGEWWRSYLGKHSEPDKRPNAAQQHADANAHFALLGNRGPTVKAMRALRADPITPPEWRESGRLPKSR